VSSINSLSACVFRSIVAHAFGTPAALMTSGRLSMLNQPPDNGVQRRAQFVRQGGEELQAVTTMPCSA
jgi:hypothetical protein